MAHQSFTQAELKWLADESDVDLLENSPWASAIASDEPVSATEPADGKMSLWQENPGAFESLARPRKLICVIIPGQLRTIQLNYFSQKADEEKQFTGFWIDEEGWRVTPGQKPADVAKIVDELFAASEELDGSVDVELSPSGLLSLASALDAIKFRDLKAMLYREVSLNDPMTRKNLENQVEIGVRTIDPRWMVSLIGLLAPPGSLSAEIDIDAGLQELAQAGFAKIEDNPQSEWVAEPKLQQLSASWANTLPAISIGCAMTNDGGDFCAADYVAVVRGLGRPVMIDFRPVLRGDSWSISLKTQKRSDVSRRLREMIARPPKLETKVKNTEPKATQSKADSQDNGASSEQVRRRAAETAVQQIQKGKSRFCSSCRTELRPGAKFCAGCGSVIATR